jgi:hypothetical protein
MTVSSIQYSYFLLLKIGSISVGTLVLRTICTGEMLISETLLKYPFMIKSLVHDMPLLLHEQQYPYFFNRLFIQSGMSMAFLGPFLGALWKNKTHGYCM